MAREPKTVVGSVDIVIVDDDLAVRQGLRETLEGSGFVCHVEEDGLRAFEWLRDGGNDCRLILLDMATPRINGWQFLELRARSPKISRVPVIVFSAMPLERLKGLDVAEIVRKPGIPARLLSAIRRSLDGGAGETRKTPVTERRGAEHRPHPGPLPEQEEEVSSGRAPRRA